MFSFGTAADEGPTRENVEGQLIADYGALLKSWQTASTVEEKESAKDGFLDLVERVNDMKEEPSNNVRKLKVYACKNAAQLYEMLGDAKEAMGLNLMALEMDGSDVVLAHRTAQAAWKAGNVRLARRTLESALLADPRFWPALSLLTEMLYSIGDALGTMDAVSRCLQVYPYDARSLSIQATLVMRHGVSMMGSSTVATTAPIMLERPHQMGADGAKKKPSKPIVVRVNGSSWRAVLSGMAKALNSSSSGPVEVSWKPAQVLTPSKLDNKSGNNDANGGNDDDEDDDNDEEEEGRKMRGGDLKALLLRFIVPQDDHQQQQQQQQHEDQQEDAGDGAAAANDISLGSDDTEIGAVSAWLSSHLSASDPVSLVRETVSHILGLPRVRWTPLMRKHLVSVAYLLIAWDVPGNASFLALAELQLLTSTSMESLERSQTFLERFCFAFPEDLSRAGPVVLRVEFVKGLLLKPVDAELAMNHLQVCMAMLRSMDEACVSVPHCGFVIDEQRCRRELSSLDQDRQLEEGQRLVKRSKLREAVEVLGPMLLPPASRTHLGRREEKLLQDLCGALQQLYRKGSSGSSDDALVNGKLLSVALVELIDVRRQSLKSSHNTSNHFAPLAVALKNLASLLLDGVGLEENAARARCLNMAARIILLAKEKKEPAKNVLAASWELLVLLLPRPRSLETLKLELFAQQHLAEYQMCRNDGGRLLQVLLDDFVEAEAKDEFEADSHEFRLARNQALGCLYDAGRFKTHQCPVQPKDVKKSEVMAEAFRHIKDISDDPDVAKKLLKNIHAHFAKLPTEEMHARLKQIEAIFQGTSDESPTPLLDDAALEFRDVHAEIHHHAVKPFVRFFKPVSNHARVSSNHWLSKKSWRDQQQSLLKDLAFNPRRYMSWYWLGVLCRARADFLVSSFEGPLSDMDPAVVSDVGELRMQSLRSFSVALSACVCTPEERNSRAHALLEMALTHLAASRMLLKNDDEDAQQHKELMERALQLTQRSRGVDSSIWLGCYLLGWFGRKLRLAPQDYLAHFAEASTGQKKTKRLSALYKLHSARLKLVLWEGCEDLALLDKYCHGPQPSDPNAGLEERRQHIAADAMAGLLESECEDTLLRSVHLRAKALFKMAGGRQGADEEAQRLVADVFQRISTSGAGSIALATGGTGSASSGNNNVQQHLSEVVGYGYPEHQVVLKQRLALEGVMIKVLKRTLDLREAMLLLHMDGLCTPKEECCRMIVSIVDSQLESIEDNCGGGETGRATMMLALEALYSARQHFEVDVALLLRVFRQAVEEAESLQQVLEFCAQHFSESDTLEKLKSQRVQALSREAPDKASPNYSARRKRLRRGTGPGGAAAGGDQEGAGDVPSTLFEQPPPSESYECDAEGRPILPIVTPEFKVRITAWGEIRPGCRSKKDIFPIGFRSEKEHFSVIEPSTKCTYVNEILMGEDSRRLFRVTCHDGDGGLRVFEGPSPSNAWTKVNEALRDRKIQLGSKIGKTTKANTVSGPGFFGLKEMRDWIAKFPGADQVEDEGEDEGEGEGGGGGGGGGVEGEDEDAVASQPLEN